MRAALAAGAAIINDVRALQQPGAAEVVAEHDCGVVLMHMQGAPATMQQAPHYRDVTKDVVQFLAQRVQYARRGVSTCGALRSIPASDSARPTRIISRFCRSYPNWTYAGSYRRGAVAQSDAGRASGRAVDDRAAASVAAAVLAAERGATLCVCTTLRRRAMH